MDDRTKELLTELKAYFDQMEPSTETFDDVSRFCLMCSAQAGKIVAYLAPVGSADRLLNAQTTIMNGFLEMSEIIKQTKQSPVNATDILT